MKPFKNIQGLENSATPSFYEEVLMNIPADIAVYNTKGEFLFINSAVIKEAATREWLIGKNIDDYCRIQQSRPNWLSGEKR